MKTYKIKWAGADTGTEYIKAADPDEAIEIFKVEEKTAKDWFQKINEELDEFKDTVMGCRWLPDEVKALNLYIDEKNKIVEEAADTITTITSML